jgi:hypothetical protein
VIFIDKTGDYPLFRRKLHHSETHLTPMLSIVYTYILCRNVVEEMHLQEQEGDNRIPLKWMLGKEVVKTGGAWKFLRIVSNNSPSEPLSLLSSFRLHVSYMICYRTILHNLVTCGCWSSSAVRLRSGRVIPTAMLAVVPARDASTRRSLQLLRNGKPTLALRRPFVPRVLHTKNPV